MSKDASRELSEEPGGHAVEGGPPRWVWLAYLVLFGLSVPWYLPSGPVAIWFGLPYWVVMSLGAIGTIAVFTLFVVGRYWHDDHLDKGRAIAGRSLQ